MQHYPMAAPALPTRRSSRRWIMLALAVVILAGGWTAVWFYAADRANQALAGWLEREARLGRVYGCGSQSLGGFPFRIEVRCREAVAELRTTQPAMSVRMADILIAAQIYQPTLLIGEWTGPVVFAESGQTPKAAADWTLAQTSVRGNPRSPERISIVFENPVVDRFVSGTPERIASGRRAEIHARMASGNARERPVVDLALRLMAMAAPGLHPLAAGATDADIDATLQGLKDLSPKPWNVRFREIQQSGGRIEIRSSRVAQGEWLAVGAGSLGISANGRLDGQLRVTVAGLEKLLQQLGVEYLNRPGGGSDKLNSAIGALDRLMPGLGQVARESAAPALAAGAALLGEPAELEGKRAVTLPLRFEDGRIYLGRIAVGQTPALF